jgi:hypothetical protein
MFVSEPATLPRAVHDLDVSAQWERPCVRGIEINAGITIVPHGTITQEVAKQTLVEIKIEDQEFFRPLAAIHKKNKVLSPAMKQFLPVLKGPG